MSLLQTVFRKIFFLRSYGSELENYIISRHPQNAGDVERLEKEYVEKLMRG